MNNDEHLKKMAKKFTTLNFEQYGIAAIPEVGLFWMSLDGKHLHKKSVDLKHAVDYGDFLTCDVSHYDEWPNAQRANPEWADKEYEEVTRGRVVCNPVRNGEFIIYLPKELAKHKGKILKAFHIPVAHAEIDTSDIHYRLPNR